MDSRSDAFSSDRIAPFCRAHGITVDVDRVNSSARVARPAGPSRTTPWSHSSPGEDAQVEGSPEVRKSSQAQTRRHHPGTGQRPGPLRRVRGCRASARSRPGAEDPDEATDADVEAGSSRIPPPAVSISSHLQEPPARPAPGERSCLRRIINTERLAIESERARSTVTRDRIRIQ